MAGIKERLTRRDRRRWAIAMGAVVLLVVTSGLGLYLVQHQHLAKSPWQYLAVAAAVIAGLVGLAVTFMEGLLESNLTSRSVRTDRARKLRRHHRRHPVRRHLGTHMTTVIALSIGWAGFLAILAVLVVLLARHNQ